MPQIPILFLGDSPNLKGGLSRIGRDLATLTSTLPEFKVGYLGRGGRTSSQLPFIQYNFPESDQWGETHIESVWQDFARSEKGIIFSIWDLSRLHWLSRGNLRNAYPFSLWGYFPIDAQSINGLTSIDKYTCDGFDRRLGYSRFGATILGSDWIPHGIDCIKFQPREQSAGRLKLGFDEDDIVIGCVMANQARKDWGCAFSSIAELYKTNKRIRFWVHIDTLQRSHAWNIPALIEDFGLGNLVKVTLPEYNDTEMSYMYSACNMTILPSSEGFGYPIAESLSCNVPVITSSYAAGAELIQERDCLIDPKMYRIEGLSNLIRPVFDPSDFVHAMNNLLARDEFDWRDTIVHLNWKELWPSCWRKWFLEGIK